MALLNEDKANILFKHYLGTGSTRLSREFFEEAVKSSFVVKPDQLWKYSDKIPDGSEETGGPGAIEKIKALTGTGDSSIYTWFKSESEPKYPIVRKWTKLKLTKVDAGTNNSFLIIDPETSEPLKNIIPFNYGKDESLELYNYTLYLPNGATEVPFGVGDWVVDTYSGVLTFYDKVPEGIDNENPPLLTFYQYVGGNGFRQDINGFEAAIIPLDNISIENESCVVTDGIYQKIIEATDKVSPGFADTYGFDGTDDNEGIALSFEKIIPLLYTDTRDPVKGYDESADQVVRSLLSSKQSSIPEVLFVSQATPEEEFTIEFVKENEQLIAKVGELSTPVDLADRVWKLNLDKDGKYFAIIKAAEYEAPLVFTVSDGAKAETPKVSCALLYWNASERDFLPFINEEERLYSTGIPIVAAQGKIPPSIKLNTDTLDNYHDIITPDYYGPRTVGWVIAHEGGRDIKSADFIVKDSKPGHQLIDAIKAGQIDCGKVYIRDGNYEVAKDFTLSGKVVYEAECNAILNGNIYISPGKGNLTVVNGLQVNGDLTICGEGLVILNNTKAKNLILKDNARLEVRNSRFADILLEGGNPENAVVLHATHFNNLNTKRDNIYVESCNFNEFTKEGEDAVKPILIESSIIKVLNSKTAEIHLYSNYIGKWNVGGNQTPVSPNPTDINTSGRLPLYSKGDTQHKLYAEFAKPFNYYKAGDTRSLAWPEQQNEDVIELLYNTKRLYIDDTGSLDIHINTDDITMPDGTVFPRGDNSWDYDNTPLADKTYDSKDKITKVLQDLWHEKADLNERGKVPLQQLPDEVAYGGLLYIGNWCFDAHDGLYPTQEDIDKIFIKDPDPEKPRLQPGWFFIIEPPETPDEEEEKTDNPVKPQIAVDGVVFTAGDWLVVQARESEGIDDKGKGWVKVDRAYSEPIYSILSSHTERVGQADTEWWWKDDGAKGGALDLGSKTIIEAFDKINMQLRKLEPKKPDALADMMLALKDEDTIPYVDWRVLKNPEIRHSIDLQKVENITFETKSASNKSGLRHNYFYFSEEASLASKLSDEVFLPPTIITINDDEEKIVDTTTISQATEVYTNENHGEGFWKGMKVTSVIPKEKMTKGKNTFKLSLDDCKLLEGKDRLQDIGYNGTIQTSFDVVDPYFNYLSKNIANQSLEFDVITDIMKKGICSGNYCTDARDLGGLYISADIANVYHDNIIPAGVIGEVYAEVNGRLITEKLQLDSLAFSEISLINNGTLQLKNLKVPFDFTLYDIDTPIRREDKIEFYLTLYDFYGEAHTEMLFETSGVEIDKVDESERLTHGVFGQNSQLLEIEDTTQIGYGDTWNSLMDLHDCQHNSLQKIGRWTDYGYVQEYRWPEGNYSNDGKITKSYDDYIGEQIGEDFYAGACFKIGELHEASGFSFKINASPDMIDAFKYDTLTGATENLLIQCCVRDNSGADSVWINCNFANNGFLQPKQFNDPAMYAGHSSALVKRVTFGHQCLSGDLYLRIAIKKDSGLKFQNITLIEVI